MIFLLKQVMLKLLLLLLMLLVVVFGNKSLEVDSIKSKATLFLI